MVVGLEAEMVRMGAEMVLAAVTVAAVRVVALVVGLVDREATQEVMVEAANKGVSSEAPVELLGTECPPLAPIIRATISALQRLNQARSPRAVLLNQRTSPRAAW